VRLLADLRSSVRAVTSAGQAGWLPGQFRRLLHHVPEKTDVLRFRHLALPWSSCLVPTLLWTGRLPDYPLCPACLAKLGHTGKGNSASSQAAPDDFSSSEEVANSLHSEDLDQYALLSGVIEMT
jgi:hypothetical protein